MAESPARPVRPYNRALGRLRILATFVAVGALVALSSPRPAGLIAGAVLVGCGETLRVWSSGLLRKTVELSTSGPYRYTRNPLYLGRLLIFTGVAIAATLPFQINLVVLLVGWMVFFGYYLPRKERVEPTRLREVHGEVYERYRRAVPALFPSLRPYAGGGSAPWSAGQAAANGEHWMVIGLAALLAVLALKAYGLLGTPAGW